MAPGVQQPARAAWEALVERWRERYHARRRLKFTREGWYYCLFALGVGAAALNTGNNLLFLVLGLQLSAIVISGILSESALRGLQIERVSVPDPAAGERFQLTYRVRNRKRFWPSYTLLLGESEGPLRGAQALLLQVAPGRAEEASLRAAVGERGRYPLEWVAVRTRFPFGLFEKSTELRVPGELWVLPARVPSQRPGPLAARREGERPQGQAGHGAEFHGLREVRPGDDRRLIHWRKSAAAGRLLVIERERERRRRVVLVVDNRRLPPQALEQAVRQAAAAARLLASWGTEVGLAAANLRLAPAGGPAALREVLRQLAVLAPAPAGAPAPDDGGDAAWRLGQEAAP